MEPVYFLMLSEHELNFIRDRISPQWTLARADLEENWLYCLKPAGMPEIDLGLDIDERAAGMDAFVSGEYEG
jgi:hypothetical protein